MITNFTELAHHNCKVTLNKINKEHDTSFLNSLAILLNFCLLLKLSHHCKVWVLYYFRYIMALVPTVTWKYPGISINT